MKLPRDIKEAADQVGLTEAELADIGQRMAKGQSTAEDKKILDQLTPEQTRPCGDCDFCCTAPAIEAQVLDADDPDDRNFAPKAACERCQFANGNGCGIYEQRPGVCKSYQCLWSMGLVPAVNYPMKRGVAWTFQPVEEAPGATILMGHCTDVDAVMKDRYNSTVIAQYLRPSAQASGIHGVVIRDSKKARCFRPDGTGAEGLIDQSDPMKMKIDTDTEVEFTFKTQRYE